VLIHCNWLRVILDEAHCIRNQRTLVSKVCCNLKTEHRWCVSGTIIQNSLDDVFGIMKFLQHEPWCLPPFWKAAIAAPANAKSSDDELDPQRRCESLQIALDRVRRLLGPLMLRRTKDSVTKDGEPILTLPPVETKVVTVELCETEREFYNAVLARSLQVFDGFVEAGTASKAYFQIFSMLSRLRQVCDHIALTVKSKLDDDDWLASANQEYIGDEASEGTAKALAKEVKETDALGTRFLDGLLKKFCEKQQSPRKDLKRGADAPTSSSKRAKEKAYISRVAQALSQAVQEKSTHIEEECAICLENPKIDDAVLTPCAHIFCRRCLVDTLRSQAPAESKDPSKISSSMGCPDGKCPTCQEKVEAKRIIALSKSCDVNSGAMTSSFLTQMKPSASRSVKQEVRETQEGNPFVLARQILKDAISGTESSKMKAVMQELNAVWTLDPGSKVLIFSHYLGFLDLLGSQLRNNGIPFFRLDGSLTLNERMKVLDQFRLSEQALVSEGANANTVDSSTPIKKGTVMLLSMSAGGEGLNITSASSCFILEPW
jgi:DNA repair protein RAD5